MRLKILALAVVAAAAGAAQAVASADGRQAHGLLRSELLTTGCTSPIGLCTAGRLTGTVNGDFVFAANRLEPTDTPGISFYTGEIVVETQKGELRCASAGVYSFVDPAGPVVDMCTITSGTGDWAGTTGHLRIHGTFSLTEGGFSHYEGSITK